MESNNTTITYDSIEYKNPYSNNYYDIDDDTYDEYENYDDFKAMYKRVYDFGRSHFVLPTAVTRYEPERDVEIFGKHYRELTEREEIAFRYAMYCLEYYFEVGCRRF